MTSCWSIWQVKWLQWIVIEYALNSCGHIWHFSSRLSFCSFPQIARRFKRLKASPLCCRPSRTAEVRQDTCCTNQTWSMLMVSAIKYQKSHAGLFLDLDIQQPFERSSQLQYQVADCYQLEICSGWRGRLPNWKTAWDSWNLAWNVVNKFKSSLDYRKPMFPNAPCQRYSNCLNHRGRFFPALSDHIKSPRYKWTKTSARIPNLSCAPQINRFRHCYSRDWLM